MLFLPPQRPSRLAGQIVEREQADQDSVSVDYWNAPGAVLPHQLSRGIEIVFRSGQNRIMLCPSAMMSRSQIRILWLTDGRSREEPLIILPTSDSLRHLLNGFFPMASRTVR